jgi:hypothetical protein
MDELSVSLVTDGLDSLAAPRSACLLGLFTPTRLRDIQRKKTSGSKGVSEAAS